MHRAEGCGLSALASAALCLALSLSGCAKVDTTAPSSAGAEAAPGAPAHFGTVDCSKVNGAKPE